MSEIPHGVAGPCPLSITPRAPHRLQTFIRSFFCRCLNLKSEILNFKLHFLASANARRLTAGTSPPSHPSPTPLYSPPPLHSPSASIASRFPHKYAAQYFQPKDSTHQTASARSNTYDRAP